MKKIIVLILAVLLGITACKKGSLRTEEKIVAENFLSSRKYEKLIIEIVYEKGYALSSEAKSHLQNFLVARLNKPKGIVFVEREISSRGKAFMSEGDVADIENEFRTNFSKGSIISVFVFSSGADYSRNSGNSKVLGIAYRNTSIALFEKTIHSYSGGLTQPARHILEATVVEHEFGHLLGLVDNGTGMVQYHRDVQHGHHCNDKNCLMYYTAETSDIISNLLGGKVPGLENNCIKDLQSNGGK